MSDLIKTIGKRLRHHRTARNMSQEKLAELSGCHPTYIGQVERGEKNATLESIAKIASAMALPLAQLFEQPGEDAPAQSPALRCYELIAEKSPAEQEQLYRLLVEIDAYRKQ